MGALAGMGVATCVGAIIWWRSFQRAQTAGDRGTSEVELATVAALGEPNVLLAEGGMAELN